jgi:IS30 family transposase
MTRKRWKNPDKRMAQAVELRARGWSLRRIGTQLAVSQTTIQRDLARFALERKTDKPQLRIVTSASHPAVTLRPNVTAGCDKKEEAG